MKRLPAIALGLSALLLAGAAAVGTWYRTAPDAMEFAGDGRVALADYRGSDPTGVPPELRASSLVERGAYLARAADCAPCHTLPGRPEFSGGRAFKLPFGTIYSSNITPDPKHGIGGWTDRQFINAVKHGRARDGKPLYPAMPYTSYAGMTDDDARAIHAYLASLAPVPAREPASNLRFPFSQRGLMPVWSWFFAKEELFRPDARRSPEWNRGAYLAEPLGHCGECHTPRNLGYGLDNRNKYAGEVTAGWKAHNITNDRRAGIGGWSDGELTSYLSTGFAAGRGAAGGPMGEAIDHGLRYLTPSDTAALLTYLRSIPAIYEASDVPRTKPAPEGFARGHTGSEGERLFGGNCAGCHDWTGVSPLSPHARLTGIRSVSDPSASNIVQSILWGVDRRPPDGMAPMPAFGTTLSDREIAAIANCVSERFGRGEATLSEKEVARLRRQGAH